MSGLDKLGNAQDLDRIMADEFCDHCSSRLVSTPEGKHCFTCSIARSGTLQGEPAWDEFREISGAKRVDERVEEGGNSGSAELVPVPRVNPQPAPLRITEVVPEPDALVNSSVSYETSNFPELIDSDAVPAEKDLLVATSKRVDECDERAEMLAAVQRVRDDLVECYQRLAKLIDRLEER